MPITNTSYSLYGDPIQKAAAILQQEKQGEEKVGRGESRL